jgi:hypothetical protein
MTLKEKIQDIQITECMAETLEYIADDYAIGFGKWILKQCISPSLNDLYVNDKGDLISVKELLEIFKKEKGL